MKTIFVFLSAALFALPACGGSDSTGGGGSGSKSDTTSGGTTSGGNTTSGQTCSHDFGCVNGDCACAAGPNKDQPCCDPDDDGCSENKCDTYCQYCQ
jgi:hypothetical protein